MQRGFRNHFLLLLLLFCNLIVFFLSAGLGRESMLHLLFFPMICVPAIFFGRKDRAAILLGMLLPCVLFSSLRLTGYSFDWIASYQATEAFLANLNVFSFGFAFLLTSGFSLYLAFSKDDTERALRELNERLVQVTSHIDEVIWLTDVHKNRIVYISPAYERVWGRSCEGLYRNPKSFIDAIHSEDRDAVLRALEVQAEGKYDIVYRVVQPSGAIRWVHDRAFPVRNEQGEIDRICGIAFDITSRKLADEKLRRSEQFLTTFFEHVPVMAYAKDAEGRYIMSNPRHYEGFGLPREKVIGSTDHDILPPVLVPSCVESDRKVMESGVAQEFEDVVKLDEGMHYFMTVKFPLKDERGQIYSICGVTADRTERIKMEQALEEERAKMAAYARLSALGEMAAGLAHEINTPLATVSTFSAQLQELAAEADPDRPAIARISASIEATILRISKIIKSLRSLARDGSGDPFVSTPVRQLLDDSFMFCHQRLNYHGVSLRVSDLPDGLTLECRPTEIGQVLINLINNAHDAVQSLDEKWIEISVSDQEEAVRFAITDSGNGIPQGILHKLFLPFFTTKEVGKGTGLGLSISHGIIQNHKGSLEVDTSCEHTRFVFTLPKKQMQKP